MGFMSNNFMAERKKHWFEQNKITNLFPMLDDDDSKTKRAKEAKTLDTEQLSNRGGAAFN